MYDSFTAAVTCPHCKHKFVDDNIQSKDFECVLDHLNQGEDTRQTEAKYIDYADSFILKKKELDSLEKAIEFQKQNTKYKLDIWRSVNNEVRWALYEFLGHAPSTFSGTKDRTFYCYTTCPKCRKWIDLEGEIKDYVFIGVKHA